MKKSDRNTEQQQPLSNKAEQLTKGLGTFVSQIINMYKSGFNSRRMLLQQSLAKVWRPYTFVMFAGNVQHLVQPPCTLMQALSSICRYLASADKPVIRYCSL